MTEKATRKLPTYERQMKVGDKFFCGTPCKLYGPESRFKLLPLGLKENEPMTLTTVVQVIEIHGDCRLIISG
jgi:hypothetical protein